jgi:hypothetical protein
VLLLEAALRLAGFTPNYIAADPVVGYRFIPRAPYKWIAEGGSSGRINGDGWRDVDHPLAKPPGTTRILMLGDSFTAAFQVPLDSTFHRRLERELNAGGAGAGTSRRWDVVAMGQDGNGTTAEYLTYRDRGARYDPDVVAVLFILNDAADNWKPVALDQARPFFIDDGDSLRLDRSFADTPGYRKYERWPWIKAHSALWALAHRAVGVWSNRLHPSPGPEAAPAAVHEPALATTPGRDGYYRDWNFDARLPADSIPAFRLTEKILGRFADQVHRDGRRFVLFAAGFAFQEDHRLLADCRRDPNFDPEKTTRWLRSIGERYGFDVVPLSPAFRAASDSLDRPLWFGTYGHYGHWNATGHAVAAKAMADYFEHAPQGGS